MKIQISDDFDNFAFVVFAKALKVVLQPQGGITKAGKELLNCPYLTLKELFPQISRASES